MTTPKSPKVLTSRKSTPDAKTRDGIRWLCKTDLYAFARQILGYADPTAGFHKPICNFAQTTPYKRNLYLVQRGAFKTTLLSVALNIQRILRNPDIRILIASNKAENAEAILAEIKGHLAGPVLPGLFPEIFHADPSKADVWKTSQIAVKTTKRRREPTITTIGEHGELTGRHYDHATFDDMVGLENTMTREERQKTIAWWQAAQAILDPGATEDIAGTPWDFDDLYAWLLAHRASKGMKLGVYKRACWEPTGEADPSGWDVGPPFGRVRSTFPERFPVHESQITSDRQQALLTLRAESPTRFAAFYLLDPVDEETAVFPRAKAVVRPRREFPPLDQLWIVACVDVAISQKGWADYTAHTVVGFDHENTMWVLHLNRGRWSETQVLQEVYQGFARYPTTQAIGFEAVGFQRLFLHLFQREAERRGGVYLPIVKLERDTKQTKNTRIRVLEVPWSAGQLVLADDLPALEAFLDEAARFRLTKESTHDDMLDTLADCFQLRIRPRAPDPGERFASMDPEQAERARFAVAAQLKREQEGAAPLDRASVRMAYSIEKRLREWEQERQAVALGVNDDSEMGWG